MTSGFQITGTILAPSQTEAVLFFFWLRFLAQPKMSWRSPLTSQYSRQPLGIKVQSCPVLR